jgi:dipeptidyl aminopeptidase/acylaminoacyl peptidase
MLTRSLAVAATLLAATAAGASAQDPTPLRQSRLTRATAGPPAPFTLDEAAHDDRWIGLEARDPRWAPDGSGVYFRWNRSPRVGQDPESDPWFFVARGGRTAGEVPAGMPIPSPETAWSVDGRRAAWTSGGTLFVYAAAGGVRSVATVSGRLGAARVERDGSVTAMVGDDLYAWDAAGGFRPITRRYERPSAPERSAARWLHQQQRDLFARVREAEDRADSAAARARRMPGAPQAIPVEPGVRVEQAARSPDGRFVTFVARTPASPEPSTAYLDYVSASGYAETRRSRGKVGEAQDRFRMGVVAVDPAVDPDSIVVRWVTLPEAGGRETFVHGPWWSVEGDRAVIQVISADWHDLWIAELDPATGSTRVLAHDRDEAWLGGPPVLSNYGGPTLLRWLAGSRLVFASERTGWSHLYLIEADGGVRALTSGPWEVRAAELSRDRSTWLIGASRESASDDELYRMPAAGGELVRLTDTPGRHEGVWSPDGGRVAELFGDATSMPDLYLRDAGVGAAAIRVTASGTDAFFRHRFRQPTIESVTHPDGKPVYAAIYRPDRPNREHAAIVHVHGGGYRQFTHHGWSVYGFGLHLGLLHYLVEQGYTVMDFDYRGGAGYGRDYRTDVYHAMGRKDVDGVIPAIDLLVRKYGVDRKRVGVYGVSYGGFFTLMALFRHPGLFRAGIANAAVSDWAHYSHEWTGRILGTPADDPEAYQVSSPINYTAGLADSLLIVHGLVDDNVEFQDAARVVQKLIEDGKSFDVMYYPTQPHTIQTEPSRRDFVRRAVAFFHANLRGH